VIQACDEGLAKMTHSSTQAKPKGNNTSIKQRKVAQKQAKFVFCKNESKKIVFKPVPG
jgi:hypothetical protein